jgi:heavy-metal-associated domain-containing protein
MKVLSTVILDIPNDARLSFGELYEKLSRLRGVERVSVNPVVEKVTVDYNPSKSTVDEIRAVVAAGNGESKDDKQTRRIRPRRQR